MNKDDFLLIECGIDNIETLIDESRIASFKKYWAKDEIKDIKNALKRIKDYQSKKEVKK